MKWLHIAVSLITVGCGTAYSVTANMPHPARANGAIQGGRLVQENYPPDEVAITVFDPSQVCFDITLRGGARYSQLQSWRVTLSADGQDRREIFASRFQPVDSRQEQWAGTRAYNVQNGTAEECVRRNQYGQCDRVEHRPTYETHYERTQDNYEVVTWQTCFDNPGWLNPNTRTMTLHMDLNGSEHNFGSGRGMDFTWNFY